METINVEAIVDEVRKEIKEKDLKNDSPSFDSVEMPPLSETNPDNEKYRFVELNDAINNLNMHHTIPAAWDLDYNNKDASRIKTRIKLIIYKLNTFIIAHLTSSQNRINDNITKILNQFYAYVKSDIHEEFEYLKIQEKIEALQKQVDILNKENENYKQRIKNLEKSIKEN